MSGEAPKPAPASPASTPVDWRRLSRLVRFCIATIVLAIIVGVIYSSLLVPILISCFLTYLLLPFVDKLERRRIPRFVAAGIIILGSVAVVVFGFVRLVPVLYTQGRALLQLIPSAVNTVLSGWLPVAEQFISDLGLGDPSDVHELFKLNTLIAQLIGQVQGSMTSVWKTGASIFNDMVFIVLVPVLTFFMLKDYHSISAFLGSLVPRDLVEPVGKIRHKVSITLRSILKGQAIVAGILMVLYVIGLSTVGLQAAIAIGVIAGICRVIPYFDVLVGGVLSTIVLLSNFHGWGQVMGVVLVFLIVQAIDGAFITPAIIGERIGLHPVLVILSVFAFADWMGFWGVLLAIPVAAMIKVLIEAIVPFYRMSKAYMPRPGGHQDH